MLGKTLIVLVVLFGVAVAQDAPTMSHHFKPGDPIHFYVRFDGNPKFDRVEIYLELQGEVKPAGVNLTNGFWIQDMKEASPGLFEVNGKIAPNAATGTWVLTFVTATHDPTKKRYEYPKDFDDKVTIEVVNDGVYDYPRIKKVSPEPPR